MEKVGGSEVREAICHFRIIAKGISCCSYMPAGGESICVHFVWFNSRMEIVKAVGRDEKREGVLWSDGVLNEISVPFLKLWFGAVWCEA